MKIDEPDTQHLMKRKDAADYIDTTAGVMAVWDSTKKYNFNPIKIRKDTYYHKDDLDRYVNSKFIP